MKNLLYLFLYIPFALFGQENYSLSFDGVDDKILIQSESNDFNLNTISIITNIRWGGSNASEYSSIVDKLPGINAGYGLQIYNYNGKVGWEFANGTNYISCNGGQLVENEWTSIASTYDGNTLKLYIDGVLVNERSYSFELISNDSPLSIGHRHTSVDEYFKGQIDEVSIFNRALTQEEIQFYMTCSPFGYEEGLIGFWNFNEGSGITTDDISSNGNDGIIYGATYSEDIPEITCSQLDYDSSDLSFIGNFNGHAYYISNFTSNSSNSNSINNGSIISPHQANLLFPNLSLVSISSEEENIFINENINQTAWIGLTDFFNENNWYWLNGEDYSYNNWGDYEPNNSDNGESYVTIVPTWGGAWNDTPCELIGASYDCDNHPFIFESNFELVYGCTDLLSVNYNSMADIDDGTCISIEEYIIDSLQTEIISISEDAASSLSSLQQALDTWNTTIDLNAGWNMFGYGCPSSISVADGLSNHTESIIITKDNNGNVYMPEFGFNGIGDFTPGFGYQIKLSEAIDSFSLCDWYLNDIPEDNIVSLQEENASLQAFVDSVNASGCTDSSACNYQALNLYDDGSCEYPEHGFDCNGFVIAEIGDIIKGGYLFYIDETGQHGLVAASEDLGHFSWGCIGFDLVGADATIIGTGYQNSLDIVSGCSQETSAAAQTIAYESNGFNDWFLPSKDELIEIYNSIGSASFQSNIASFDENYWYWSSSEYNNDQSWCVNFGGGSVSPTDKSDTPKVRPIRSF